MTGLPALSDNAKRRCNPTISIGEDPVNPPGQFAQNDIFCTGQAIKIPFVINEFHEHCLSPFYWVYIQYLYSVFTWVSREDVMLSRCSDTSTQESGNLTIDIICASNCHLG